MSDNPLPLIPLLESLPVGTVTIIGTTARAEHSAAIDAVWAGLSMSIARRHPISYITNNGPPEQTLGLIERDLAGEPDSRSQIFLIGTDSVHFTTPPDGASVQQAKEFFIRLRGLAQRHEVRMIVGLEVRRWWKPNEDCEHDLPDYANGLGHIPTEQADFELLASLNDWKTTPWKWTLRAGKARGPFSQYRDQSFSLCAFDSRAHYRQRGMASHSKATVRAGFSTLIDRNFLDGLHRR